MRDEVASGYSTASDHDSAARKITTANNPGKFIVTSVESTGTMAPADNGSTANAVPVNMTGDPDNNSDINDFVLIDVGELEEDTERNEDAGGKAGSNAYIVQDDESLAVIDSSTLEYRTVQYFILLHETPEQEFLDDDPVKAMKPPLLSGLWNSTTTFEDIERLQSHTFELEGDEQGWACVMMAIEAPCAAKRANAIVAVLTIVVRKLKAMGISLAECKKRLVREFDFWLPATVSIKCNSDTSTTPETLLEQSEDGNYTLRPLSQLEQTAHDAFYNPPPKANEQTEEKRQEQPIPAEIVSPRQDGDEVNGDLYREDTRSDQPDAVSQTNKNSQDEERRALDEDEWRHPSLASHAYMVQKSYEFIYNKKLSLEEACETSKAKLSDIKKEISSLKQMLVQFNENVKHQLNEDVASQIAALHAKMDSMGNMANAGGSQPTPPPPTRRMQWLAKFGIREDQAEKPMGLELPVSKM